jgi:succinylglutamate desuccinylase
MKTSTWGPVFWRAMHAIAHQYDGRNKDDYNRFFNMLAKVIPCKTCRKHYKQQLPIPKRVFEGSENLSRWVYMLHTTVNRRVAEVKQISYNPPTFEAVSLHYKSKKRLKTYVVDMAILIDKVPIKSEYIKTIFLRYMLVLFL